MGWRPFLYLGFSSFSDRDRGNRTAATAAVTRVSYSLFVPSLLHRQYLRSSQAIIYLFTKNDIGGVDRQPSDYFGTHWLPSQSRTSTLSQLHMNKDILRTAVGSTAFPNNLGILCTVVRYLGENISKEAAFKQFT